MKRVLLVASHLGANSSSLCSLLNTNKMLHWVEKNFVYVHPNTIELVTSTEHKFNDDIGIYVNDVLYNHQIQHKGIYQVCDFIYLINNPRQSGIQSHQLSYYIFRLRRLYEMAKETGGIFLTWDEVTNGKGLNLLEKKFGLLGKLNLKDLDMPKLPLDLLKRAESAYERCLYRMNQLNLDRPSVFDFV